MTNICFISSSGGHLQELASLRDLAKIFPSFLITERDQFNNITFGDKIYHVSQINRRENFFLIHFIKLFFLIFFIFIKERPSCIITTGALVSFPACILGKLFGAKIIYIESFARVYSPSLTGKLVYKIADVFIVQWKPLLKFYPSAIYMGGIF